MLEGTDEYGSIGRFSGMAIPQAYLFFFIRESKQDHKIFFSMWFHGLRLLQNYENCFGILLDTWDGRSSHPRTRETEKKKKQVNTTMR